MSAERSIELCGRTVPLYPQRIGYVRARILRGLAELQQVVGVDGVQVVDVDRAVYRALERLAPNVPKYVPMHTFLGYGSPEAMEAGDYDPELDESPTIPEVRAAIVAAAEVSGLDVVKHLRSLVDPTVIRELVTGLVEEAIAETLESTSSASSPSENGGSPTSTRSMTSAPTSTPVPA